MLCNRSTLQPAVLFTCTERTVIHNYSFSLIMGDLLISLISACELIKRSVLGNLCFICVYQSQGNTTSSVQYCNFMSCYESRCCVSATHRNIINSQGGYFDLQLLSVTLVNHTFCLVTHLSSNKYCLNQHECTSKFCKLVSK